MYARCMYKKCSHFKFIQPCCVLIPIILFPIKWNINKCNTNYTLKAIVVGIDIIFRIGGCRVTATRPQPRRIAPLKNEVLRKASKLVKLFLKKMNMDTISSIYNNTIYNCEIAIRNHKSSRHRPPLLQLI